MSVAPGRKDLLAARVWLRSYDRASLGRDVTAGITLAAYVLPAAIGDASLAGLPPEAGLYACLFGGLVFWLFCSSRHTAVTVTSAISLLIGRHARRDRRRRSCAPRHARRGNGAARGTARVRRLRRPGRDRRQLLLGNRARRLQVRRRAVPGEHAVTQVVRHTAAAMATSGSALVTSLPVSASTNAASLALGVAALAVLLARQDRSGPEASAGGAVCGGRRDHRGSRLPTRRARRRPARRGAAADCRCRRCRSSAGPTSTS